MSHFQAVRGSIGPSLQDTISRGATPLDFSIGPITSVTLRLRHGATGETVDFAMSFDPGTAGVVTRVWTSGDLDIREGRWFGRYLIASTAGVEIWPSPDDGCHPFGWDGLEFVICPAS